MIEELLTGRREPGIHLWEAGHQEAARGVTEAERAGHRVFWLEGRGVRDKRAFLDLCAVEFTLPSTFGRNWDALQDCLYDLSWVPATRGYLVVYDHWQDLSGGDPAAHGVVLDIFEQAVTYWRNTATPMSVLMMVGEA